MRIQLIAMALLAGLALVPGAAFADPSSAVLDARASAARVGVVSVGIFGEVAVSTGSGFALPENMLVTNAHVVSGAIQNTASVIWIVPPEGRGAVKARIVRYDLDADLALLSYDGDALKPLTISMAPLQQGAEIFALGYPDIEVVSTDDLFLPLSPGLTTGAISTMRTLTLSRRSVDMVFHSAGISSGNSGGPLLDVCGRVIGVNTLVRSSAPTSAARGIAVGARELNAFLQRAGAAALVVEDRCVTAAEKAELDALARQANVDTQLSAYDNRLAAQNDALENLRIMLGGMAALAGLLFVGLIITVTVLMRRLAALKTIVEATPPPPFTPSSNASVTSGVDRPSEPS